MFEPAALTFKYVFTQNDVFQMKFIEIKILEEEFGIFTEIIN